MTPDLEPTTATDVRLEQFGHRGSYRESPVDGMGGIFRCTWSRRVADAPTSPPIRVLPDNCADFIAADDGRAWLVGSATRVDVPALPPGTILRGLRIEPHAIGAVLNIDAFELTDRRASFDALLPSRSARLLGEALMAGRIDHQLLRELWPRIAVDERVARGIGLLAALPNQSVEEIAGTCAMSPRQFRRMVRQASGLPPKTLQRVSRLHRVLDIANHAHGTPLVMIAAEAGYADQSHLARDTRELAGLTPGELLRVHG